MKIKNNDKIFVAGHNGLVGSAIVRQLKEKKFKNILVKSKKSLNLLDQNSVYKFLNTVFPSPNLFAVILSLSTPSLLLIS